MLLHLALVACKTYMPYPWREPVLKEDLIGTNPPPRIVSIRPSHEKLYTNDRLQLVPTVESSISLGSVTVRYEWHRVEPDGSDVHLNSVTGSTLDGEFFFEKNDQIYAILTPFDGIAFGDPVTTEWMTILNSPPSTPLVNVEPFFANILGEDLTCSITQESEDLDGDALLYRFDWLDPLGQEVGGSDWTADLSVSLPNENLTEGDWTCRVTAYDGEESGIPGEEVRSVEKGCFSVSFDGEDDYIDANWPTDSFLSGTISFWIHTEEEDGALFHAGSSLSLRLASGHIHGCSDGVCSWVEGTTYVADGMWHHVALAWTPSNTELYIDGILESQTETGDLPISSPGFSLGLHESLASYRGLIHDLRLWSHSLSSNDVQQVQQGMSVDSPELVWIDSQSSGAILIDRTGHENEGVMYGLDWENRCPGEDFDADGVPSYRDCDDLNSSLYLQSGLSERCAVESCAALKQMGSNRGTRVYWIQPTPNMTQNWQAYCDMSHEQGGWMLASVVSDDGQSSWTWNQRDLWHTGTEAFGSLDALYHDFKSPVLSEMPFRDLLFVHHPSMEWAVYEDVGDGTQTLGAFLETIGESICWGSDPGYPMTAGSIAATTNGLCSTSLFFNAQEQYGYGNCLTDEDSYGPTWSVYSPQYGCPLSDPGISGSLGAVRSIPDYEYPVLGFGSVLGLNTGDSGAGENYMHVFVR